MAKNDNVLELYKIMVDSANKVTEWRQKSNEFFLAINSALIATSTYLFDIYQTPTAPGIAAFGIILSVIWYESVKSYSKLSSAKWKVVSEMEQREFKYPIFQMERKYYKEARRRGNASVEKMVPLLFIVMYAIILIFWFKLL